MRCNFLGLCIEHSLIFTTIITASTTLASPLYLANKSPSDISYQSSSLPLTAPSLFPRGRPIFESPSTDVGSSSTSISDSDDEYHYNDDLISADEEEEPTRSSDDNNAQGSQIHPVDAASSQSSTQHPSSSSSPPVQIFSRPDSLWEYHFSTTRPNPTTTPPYPHLPDIITSAIQYIHAAYPLSALVPLNYDRPIANLANFDVNVRPSDGGSRASTSRSRTTSTTRTGAQPLLNLEVRVDLMPFRWAHVVDALDMLRDWITNREAGVDCVEVFFNHGMMGGQGVSRYAVVRFGVAGRE